MLIAATCSDLDSNNQLLGRDFREVVWSSVGELFSPALSLVFTVSRFQGDKSPLIAFIQLLDHINQFQHPNWFRQTRCRLSAVSFIISAKRRKSATWSCNSLFGRCVTTGLSLSWTQLIM